MKAILKLLSIPRGLYENTNFEGPDRNKHLLAYSGSNSSNTMRGSDSNKPHGGLFERKGPIVKYEL